METKLGEEQISKFDMLFARPIVKEEFEFIEDNDSVTMGPEVITDAVTEYPSVNGGIFDWGQLDEGVEI